MTPSPIIKTVERTWSVMTLRDTSVFVLAIGHPGDTADMFHDVLNRIHFKKVVHPLHDAGQAF